MKTKGFATTGLLLLIIGLLVGGIAVFAYFQLKPTTNPNLQPNPQAISSPVISPVLDKTADWETYTDNNLKIQIKYPSNWVVTSSPRYDNAIDKNITGYTLLLKNNENRISILSCCAGGTDAKQIDIENIAIGNKSYEFVYYSFSDDQYGFHDIEEIINENTGERYSVLIIVNKNTNQANIDEIYSILSTAQFTK